MRSKIKIKDIAAKCGLSNTLVSLVLNDKASLHGIKADTQEKVLFAARQMGYFDTTEEDGVSKQKSEYKLVGMVVPEMSDQFISKICPLIDDAFSGFGLSLSVISRSQDNQRFQNIISNLKKFFCGAIIYGEIANDKTIRALKASNYPFVVLEKHDLSQRINIVNSDIHDGYMQLAQHIAALAYTRVSLISVADTNNKACLKIAIKVLNENIPGLVLNEISLNADFITGSIDYDKILDVLRPPLSSEIILLESSDLVYPVLTLLNDKKVRVPGDIALISLDDGIGFDLFSSPLTSIQRDYSALASKVSHMLWSEIKNSGKSKYKRSVKISPKLIVRKSCGTQK